MKKILALLAVLAFASVSQAASLTVRWSYSHRNETGFKVYRAPAGPAGGVTWTQVADVNWQVKSITQSGLPANTMYQYRMVAYNGSSVSPYSNIKSQVTKRTAFLNWVNRTFRG